MESDRRILLETAQHMIVRFIATTPVGEGLRLIGGFRHRLLDGSCRTSLDIDYHWDGDLEKKRDEILAALGKKLIGELERQLDHEATVAAPMGPDADSPLVKTALISLFRPHVPARRIEIPIDVTRIACLDPPVVRTAGGTVYLTVSDADMAESKMLALCQRVYVQQRDILDLFLFQDALGAEARMRLNEKLRAFAVKPGDVMERLDGLRRNLSVHARGVDAIIDQQVDTPSARHLMQAGGGMMICKAVFDLMADLLHAAGG